MVKRKFIFVTRLTSSIIKKFGNPQDFARTRDEAIRKANKLSKISSDVTIVPRISVGQKKPWGYEIFGKTRKIIIIKSKTRKGEPVETSFIITSSGRRKQINRLVFKKPNKKRKKK